MTDITKKVDLGTPPNERYQVFTQADATAGDVIMVRDSLRKPARKVTIEAAAAMTIRFNVYQYVAPLRQPGDGTAMDGMGMQQSNISKITRYKDDSKDVITLASNDILELDGDMPISDIEIVTAAGDFEIVCI